MNQQPLMQKPHNDYPPAFERIWQAYPRRGKTKGANDNKRAAYRQYQLRLRQGESADEMLEGVKRYAEYCKSAKITGTCYVMQCRTFLGPDCHFLCEWEPPEQEKALPKSDAEWLEAGRAIGIEPKIGEPWRDFRERVRARL